MASIPDVFGTMAYGVISQFFPLVVASLYWREVEGDTRSPDPG